MKQYNFESDINAIALLTETVKCLREEDIPGDVQLQAVLPQFGNIFQSLFSSTLTLELKQKLETLRTEVLKLELMNLQLKARVTQLETESVSMQSRLSILEEERAELQAKILSFELAQLFKFYIVEPNLQSNYEVKLWRDFAPLVNEKIDKIEDSKITEDELKKWLQPLTSATEIDILELQKLIDDRHDVDRRYATTRVEDQKVFLSTVDSFDFPKSFRHTDLVKKMHKRLKSVTFKRLR